MNSIFIRFRKEQASFSLIKHLTHRAWSLKKHTLSTLFIVILVWSSPASATSVNQTEIDAELLEIDHDNLTATFTGSVVVKNKATKVFADKLVVYYNDSSVNNPDKDGQIQNIIATGHLKITPSQLAKMQ
jgi:lipopolysaccharide export system protein LptA